MGFGNTDPASIAFLGPIAVMQALSVPEVAEVGPGHAACPARRLPVKSSTRGCCCTIASEKAGGSFKSTHQVDPCVEDDVQP